MPFDRPVAKTLTASFFNYISDLCIIETISELKQSINSNVNKCKSERQSNERINSFIL